MSQADSAHSTIAPGSANSPPVTVEMPFDIGTAEGLAEITAEPDGPTWISDLWLAIAEFDRPIRVPVSDPAFDVIADAVERQHASRIDELVSRELAAREAV